MPLRVLREMLRVGRHAIVAFPNFGHWSVRLAHLLSGRRAEDKAVPARLVRLAQHPLPDHPGFRSLLAEREKWNVERRFFCRGTARCGCFPNLIAEVAVFMFFKDGS